MPLELYIEGKIYTKLNKMEKEFSDIWDRKEFDQKMIEYEMESSLTQQNEDID